MGLIISQSSTHCVYDSIYCFKHRVFVLPMQTAVSDKYYHANHFVMANFLWQCCRLTAFWLRTDPSTRQHLTTEKTDTILRPLVKHFFVEKEVTSTLLMDSLYTGLKAMKQVCKNREEMADIQWPGEDDSPSTPVVIIDKDNDMFVLADDAIQLLERIALLDSGRPHQPAGDGKSSENCSNV